MRRRRRDRALIAAARALEPCGLALGTVGNVSARDGDRVRITPTRRAYDRLRPRDLVTTDLHGAVDGEGHPSRELPLHLAVYRARPEVHAVVHTHSPHAVAWSFLGMPLTPELEEQAYYGIGEIRTAPRAPAGTPALGAAAAATLQDASAVLLAGHGVVACGATVDEALLVARVVEYHAQVAWLVRAASFGTVERPWSRPPTHRLRTPSSASISNRQPSG